MTNADNGGREAFGSARPQIGEGPPARARGMLEAAQRVLDRDGADKLTLRSVAREANETPSLVLYYFSNMDRLEAMLLDSLWHDLDVEFLSSISSMPDDVAQRVDALVDFHSSIAAEPSRYRRYFELVSGVVAKPTARTEIADIYREYRAELNVPLLTHQDLTAADTEALAALVLAIAEGLPFWQLVGNEAYDPQPGFSLLRKLLTRRLGAAVPAIACSEDEVAKETSAVDGWNTEPPAHSTAIRLLEAGHELLRSTGLKGLSFENIARASGEARPSVGYHFGNKLGFIDALCLDVFRRWSLVIEGTPWDKFLDGSGTSTIADELMPAMMEMIQVFPVIQRRAVVHEAAQTSLKTARATLAEHLQQVPESRGFADDAGTAADLILAAVTGLTLQRMYDPDGFEHHSALDQLVTLYR